MKGEANMTEDISKSQKTSMIIIARSGEERSLAYQALEAAKSGNFAEAEQLLKKSGEAGTLAQKAETELLGEEGDGSEAITMLQMHAQDHLMTSMLAAELIRELVLVYRRLAEARPEEH